MQYGPLKILSGNANRPFAERMAEGMGQTLGRMTVRRFSDGEVFVEIHENIRGRDVFIVQPTCPPVNENLMELLVIMDAAKRASADRITAVIPYFGYARQDRKVLPRTPISSKLVADLLQAAGADRILTVDLHAGQIQGFFDIPVDHLYAKPVMLKALQEFHEAGKTVVVSPDAGGVERARAFAKSLDSDLAVIDKRREGPNVVAGMNIIGDVAGKTAILLDDMVDTAGTLTQAASALAGKGASRVFACCTHAVLSGKAVSRISESVIEALIVSDTIPLSEAAAASPKIRAHSVAGLLGEAIERIHNSDSVSSLFE
ncbi:ribose-phosphate pyrophosphokinase [Myxococcota bacterium]|nr:ribose-phosphate pyrophosphokinase [Myxococcota bacterium]